jgi:hypothetical protein
MKTIASLISLAALLAIAACSRTGAAGPNGGDIVAIKNGAATAEVVSNPDTGEVLVQTYAGDLQTRRPIERLPITVGSGDDSVDLVPYPVPTDPPGMSSRFYGQAEWLRGGRLREGWMHGGGVGQSREHYTWEHGWEAGRTHDDMWEAMGEHRRMGPGRFPGRAGEE